MRTHVMMVIVILWSVNMSSSVDRTTCMHRWQYHELQLLACEHFFPSHEPQVVNVLTVEIRRHSGQHNGWWERRQWGVWHHAHPAKKQIYRGFCKIIL